MKVAFLTTTMFSRLNGPANFAVNLYNFTKKNHSKIQITFFTEDHKENNEVVQVPVKWSKIFNKLGMLIKALEYDRALPEEQFDIAVWNFSVVGWFSVFKNKKIKNIVFVNDQLSLNSKWTLNYSSIRYKIFKIFESYSCRNAEHVITNSNSIKKKLIEEYNLKPEKISVLYKGIEIPDYNQLKTDWTIDTNSYIKVGFVKTNYIEGGLEILCEALSELSDYQFEIIVAGPEKVSFNLDKYSNIKINVKGRLDRKELLSELIQTDFYCVPSLNEAFGQANIEAMALQVPTIILPTDNQLAIHDRDYCWIPKDITMLSLSSTIQELINCPISIRKNKSVKARTIIEKNYSIQNSFKVFNTILEKVDNEEF